MKKWIFAETFLLTALPLALLLYSLPYFSDAVIWMVSPSSGDNRSILQRLLDVAPIIGGSLGILVCWLFTIDLYRHKSFKVGPLFFIALVCGILASWEIAITTNAISFVLICIPTWILVGHLLFLNVRLNRQKS